MCIRDRSCSEPFNPSHLSSVKSSLCSQDCRSTAGIKYIDSGWPACHSSTVTIYSFWPENCGSECWKLKFKFLNVFLYEQECGNLLLCSEQDISSVCMSDIPMIWTSIYKFRMLHIVACEIRALVVYEFACIGDVWCVCLCHLYMVQVYG